MWQPSTPAPPPRARVMRRTDAVDASTTCNAIYEHNFSHRPSQRRVENLTTNDVAGADGWLLSPPCQPYTRQHEMTDVSDPRAASLLHLADLVV